MRIKILFAILFLTLSSYSQIPVSSGLYFTKEFSKNQALYMAKEFVMTNVIRVDTSLIRFEMDPLAASSSGELTSLVYWCNQKNIRGLVLGFFGSRWNESGTQFQAYAFKNLSEHDAKEILEKIESYMDDGYKYLSSSTNNICFKYDDMTFLINSVGGSTKIRVFWNGFDSEWSITAFNRTKKRFERKMKK